MRLFSARWEFEREIRSERPTLTRVARRLCRDKQDAEDLVAQTLLRACQARGRFDGRFLRSWLIQIMRNEWRNDWRAQQSKPPTLSIEEHVVRVEPFWDEVCWRIDSQAILEELQFLSEDHRLVIQLCDVEEMSYEETATALELPIGTVRSRLFRAREQLRNRLVERGAMEEAKA
jgi:RNA polymerase sigma-70 factor, ECF subfamily